MRASKLRVLAIAVATGRVGYVLVQGDELLDWGMSRKAAKSPAEAIQQAGKWITRLQPNLIITEDAYKARHKGARTKAIIETITDVAEASGLPNAAIQRVQAFPNKYDEAQHLATRYSDLKPWLPAKRRLWEAEPRNTVYFEALAMAEAVR